MLPSWIKYSVAPAIENRTGRQVNLATVFCEVCGEQDQAPVESGVVPEFARQHAEHRSQAEGFYGFGDAISAATKAVGIESCSPCEARRRMLNQLAPKVWWR